MNIKEGLLSVHTPGAAVIHMVLPIGARRQMAARLRYDFKEEWFQPHADPEQRFVVIGKVPRSARWHHQFSPALMLFTEAMRYAGDLTAKQEVLSRGTRVIFRVVDVDSMATVWPEEKHVGA